MDDMSEQNNGLTYLSQWQTMNINRPFLEQAFIIKGFQWLRMFSGIIVAVFGMSATLFYINKIYIIYVILFGTIKIINSIVLVGATEGYVFHLFDVFIVTC